MQTTPVLSAALHCVDEINRVAKQSGCVYHLLNPTKTQEMFSTQYVKLCTPDLVLNDTTIVLG